eukprot:CAMPEP_0115150462 /NCGR_PEP_ID=MMETSP0227-20121206/65060_1 /TAXON_ID=89957 /ORGANISM="Polarella glacialis, Strain CCMP 1383" /LENGTH=115 /DNA_ID=CAMNT_0002560845 /DNA_START=122 /DNA_END=469 /DNA_ORIENTATION=-
MNHDKYHHVIQYATPGEAKSIKICRCWQSKRFPYCDDTHKVMIEAGDNIGPYVVKINPGKGSARNVAANYLQARSGSVGMACAAGIAHARGQRLHVEVGFGGRGESSEPAASPAE